MCDIFDAALKQRDYSRGLEGIQPGDYVQSWKFHSWSGSSTGRMYQVTKVTKTTVTTEGDTVYNLANGKVRGGISDRSVSRVKHHDLTRMQIAEADYKRAQAIREANLLTRLQNLRTLRDLTPAQMAALEEMFPAGTK